MTARPHPLVSPPSLLRLLVALATLIVALASGVDVAEAQNGVAAINLESAAAVGADGRVAPAHVGSEGLLFDDGVSGCCVAPNGVADDVFHYTKGEFVDSISTNGLRPGSYATPNGNLSPLQAQLDLALPPNTGLRDAVLRVDVAGLREAGFEIPAVTRVTNTVTGSGGRVYSMPGGGYEMQFPYAVPPEFIKVVTP